MTIAPSSLPKISADAHVNEPHDLWYQRLDEGLRDRAPRRIQSNDAGGWSLVIDGSPTGWGDIAAEEAERLEREREGAASPAVRLAMMREDGINAEVIYPTIGLYLWNISDPAVGTASCKIYNDWLHEQLGGNPRIGLTAAIPTWDVDDSIGEVQRAADRGFTAHMLPIHSTPTYNQPQWEPLWSAIEETGMPVVMHQATGHEQLFYRGWGSGITNLVSIQTMAPRAAALLAASGILERHPGIHFVLVEVNGGWLGWLLEMLGEYEVSHDHWHKPVLALPASEYVKRQIHVTFQNDPLAISNRELTGVAPLLWGNDYPHKEGTYPNSAKVLDELLSGVATAEARDIVGLNAASIFKFDLELLAAPA